MKKYILYAILAAVLYAFSTPFSKLLLNELSAYTVSGLLYLGAGAGMGIMKLFSRENSYEKLTKSKIPYIVLMVLLDTVAPILLLTGLRNTNSENVSLINNFEIVVTSLFALFVFKEAISKRLWAAIVLITISSIILSVNSTEAFTFSVGSIYIIGACVCWGLENNCTRVLSANDPYKVVIIKGFGAGIAALLISLALGELYGHFLYIVLALLLGMFAYGLSIFFYVKAQRHLGASKTSAFYALAPFIGAAVAFMVFKDIPIWTFYVGLAVMITGVVFVVRDTRLKDNSSSMPVPDK